MLLGEIFHTTGNDARHRFVAIAHQYFFTVTNHLDVSTKPSFQVTDVNGFHIAIIADVTMLVILTLCLLHSNPCTSCPFIGLCLDKPDLVETALVRKPGVDLGLFDELVY